MGAEWRRGDDDDGGEHAVDESHFEVGRAAAFLTSRLLGEEGIERRIGHVGEYEYGADAAEDEARS